MHIRSKLLSAGLSIWDNRLVVTLLEVSEKEVGVVALHLLTGPLKTRDWLVPIPRLEPSTYQPNSR